MPRSSLVEGSSALRYALPSHPRPKSAPAFSLSGKPCSSGTERGIATEGILPEASTFAAAPIASPNASTLSARKTPSRPSTGSPSTRWPSTKRTQQADASSLQPTNGAAGVIPPPLPTTTRTSSKAPLKKKQEGIIRYFLTAAAIGILYKENASISGAGSRMSGRVGVACSMAAGGLVAALNGTNAQVEHAAEIAMEHNLGHDLRPHRRPRPDPLHRAQRHGRSQSHQRLPHGHATRPATTNSPSTRSSPPMYQTGLDMQSRYKEPRSPASPSTSLSAEKPSRPQQKSLTAPSVSVSCCNSFCRHPERSEGSLYFVVACCAFG